MSSTVVALFLNKGSRVPLTRVQRVQALADQGIEGDRHARPGQRRSILLMSIDDLDAFGLRPGDVREQITVAGLELQTLAEGTRLRIGGALCELGKACVPCERIEELKPGLRTAIEGRRGRFVRVIEAGTVAAGDAITPEPGA